MCPFHRHRYAPAFLKAPASFEVFESKLASRVAYGAGARYFFRQRERRFIGLSKRRTKFVFSDENGRHEDDIVPHIVKEDWSRWKRYVCVWLFTVPNLTLS